LPYWRLHDIYIPTACSAEFAVEHHEFAVWGNHSPRDLPIVHDFVIAVRQETDVATVQAHKTNGAIEERARHVIAIGGNQKPLLFVRTFLMDPIARMVENAVIVTILGVVIDYSPRPGRRIHAVVRRTAASAVHINRSEVT